METTYKHHSDYESLSPQAKAIVDKCHKQNLLTPLDACQIFLEDATVQNYQAIKDAEIYLINEA